MYEGSGPLESDRASRVADLVSRASRHGKAIAGLEASARPAAVTFREGWPWNDLVPFLELGEVLDVQDAENCLVQVLLLLAGRAAIRAAATTLLVEFMLASA